jgi:hypothetical protein
MDNLLLISIELTMGVTLDDHSKLQFPEQIDGIPFIFIEIFKIKNSLTY